jgi:hypothetical protein
MRHLTSTETRHVAGALGDPIPHDNRDQGKWGNNGFGNGSEPHNNNAPGKSGLHGPGRGAVGNGGGKRDSLGDDQGPR